MNNPAFNLKFITVNLKSVTMRFIMLLFAIFTLSFTAEANYYNVNGGVTVGPCAYTFSGVVETGPMGNIVHGTINYNGPCGSGTIQFHQSNSEGSGSDDPNDHDFRQLVGSEEVTPDLQLGHALFENMFPLGEELAEWPSEYPIW